MLEIAKKTVRAWCQHAPKATIFSVSQNDWYNFCECDQCTAMAKAEGSQIAPVLWMVNRVADAVKDEFPDKLIDTLAYQWTRKPPRTMRPAKNVVVRLCSIECCFIHPLETDPDLHWIRQLLALARQRTAAGVDYFSDASVLAAGGIPSLVFGPGDIAQAHTADEWVELGQHRNTYPPLRILPISNCYLPG